MVNNTVKAEPNKVKVGPLLHAITLQPNVRYASDLDYWKLNKESSTNVVQFIRILYVVTVQWYFENGEKSN